MFDNWLSQIQFIKSRSEDNIKMDLHEVEWRSMDWTDLAQDRGRWRANVNAVVNILVPQNAGNFLTSWEPLSFSSRTVLHGISKYNLVITVTAVSRAVKPSSRPHWLGPKNVKADNSKFWARCGRIFQPLKSVGPLLQTAGHIVFSRCSDLSTCQMLQQNIRQFATDIRISEHCRWSNNIARCDS